MPEDEVDYWGSLETQMSSLDTSNPGYDRYVAELNHALESRALVSMINRHFQGRSGLLILDIGAGLGRFSDVASRFGIVHALEPSGLSRRLQGRFKDRESVTVIGKTIQQFEPSGLYDLIIVSGVFMELEDEQVYEAFRKASACLTNGGLVFIRDLISPSVKKTHRDNSYVYFSRPLSFWRQLIGSSNLRLLKWRYSHNPYILFRLSQRFDSVNWLPRWVYSKRFHKVHFALNTVLRPFWNRVLFAFDQDRIALFFADK